jgi:hypothetical protein
LDPPTIQGGEDEVIPVTNEQIKGYLIDNGKCSASKFDIGQVQLSGMTHVHSWLVTSG